jgi:ribosomal protein L1
MSKSAATLIVLVGLGGLLGGCGGSVKVTDSWVDPNHEDQRIKSIMVLGVAKEASVRRIFEDHFVEELQAQGVDAMVSYRVLTGELNKEMIDDALAEAGVEAIMVTRAVD